MGFWRALPLAIFSGLAALAPICAAGAAPEFFAPLAARVSPAVVNISIKGMGEAPMMMKGDGKSIAYAPRMIDFVGSGVIVDPSGIIVTNNHVIDNAYEICASRSPTERSCRRGFLARDDSLTSR